MMNIAVIGAGTMGIGVALHAACHGYNGIILKDVSTRVLERSRERIIEDLRTARMMNASIRQMEIDDILSRISFSTDYEGFGDRHFVIENVSEDWSVKKEVYLELRSACSKEVKFFVNTSCISITKIAALVDHAENVIGMHFMNPVPLKTLVEVIKGYHTSESTIETAVQFLSTLKKKPVIVNDFPGFVANRLSHLFMNEAAFLIQEQVATAREVDLIFTKGYGHQMGPLATADLIGLDTVVQSLNILYQACQDTKFRCCPLLIKMVDAGLLGMKSGEGFFKY